MGHQPLQVEKERNEFSFRCGAIGLRNESSHADEISGVEMTGGWFHVRGQDCRGRERTGSRRVWIDAGEHVPGEVQGHAGSLVVVFGGFSMQGDVREIPGSFDTVFGAGMRRITTEVIDLSSKMVDVVKDFCFGPVLR